MTLDGVDINQSYPISIHVPGINCQGNTNLVLADGSENYVKALGSYHAGIFINENRTLTISGGGSLTAKGSGTDSENDNGDRGGAGIGGYNDRDGGNIVIAGGTIKAQGGLFAAGIGSGYDNHNNNSGAITISGGNVTATGGRYAAGIGTGYANDKQNQCGNITISGGTVTAKGGNNAAGIGGGYVNGNNNKGVVHCGSITIEYTVTLVTATKGSNHSNICSIGKGYVLNSNKQFCGTITIGGTVYWDKKENSSEYEYKNGGNTYLKTSPLVYEPQH